MEKKKAKSTLEHFSADSNLSVRDRERITRAFTFVLRKMQKFEDSQIEAYKYLRALRKQVRELEKRVWKFIEPS
jgi:tellurite resistance protein